MEITTRAYAREKGLKSYFTGQACKNGHLTYRYTQSGSCAACIRTTNAAPADPSEIERKAAISTLAQMRFRAFDSDIGKLTEAAWALAAMRIPSIRLCDITPRAMPTFRTSGTAMYPLYCHRDDIDTLQKIANAFVDEHKVDIEGRRQEILSNALKYADETACPTPPEKP